MIEAALFFIASELWSDNPNNSPLRLLLSVIFLLLGIVLFIRAII